MKSFVLLVSGTILSAPLMMPAMAETINGPAAQITNTTANMNQVNKGATKEITSSPTTIAENQMAPQHMHQPEAISQQPQTQQTMASSNLQAQVEEDPIGNAENFAQFADNSQAADNGPNSNMQIGNMSSNENAASAGSVNELGAATPDTATGDDDY